MIDTRLALPSDFKDGRYVAHPGDNFVQLIAANGSYVYKDCPFYTAGVEVKKTTGLAKMGQSCHLKVPRIPLNLFLQIENFFEQVYAKYKSEAVVLLYVSPGAACWRAKVPEQTVSAGSVDYDLKKMPPIFEEEVPVAEGAVVTKIKFYLFGSIHSHGSMGAFHSGTDDNDEMHFDGLHITIGTIASEAKSYATRFMIHGSAFSRLKLADAVEIPEIPKEQCEKDWLERVKEKVYAQVHTSHAYPYNQSPTAVVPPTLGKAEGVSSRVADTGQDQQAAETNGQTTTTGTAGTPSEPVAPVAQGRRMGGRRKGKDCWQRHAQYDHCYTCTKYLGGNKCSRRQMTFPFSSCTEYERNNNISEDFIRESHDYLRTAAPMGRGGGNGA